VKIYLASNEHGPILDVKGLGATRFAKDWLQGQQPEEKASSEKIPVGFAPNEEEA
jgi:hypothetical protein